MVFPRSRTSAMGTWRHFVAPLRPRPTAVMMRPLRFSPQSSKIGRGGSLSPPSASAREAVHLLWYLSQTCSICRSHIAVVTHPIRVYLMCFFLLQDLRCCGSCCEDKLEMITFSEEKGSRGGSKEIKTTYTGDVSPRGVGSPRPQCDGRSFSLQRRFSAESIVRNLSGGS